MNKKQGFEKDLLKGSECNVTIAKAGGVMTSKNNKYFDQLILLSNFNHFFSGE